MTDTTLPVPLPEPIYNLVEAEMAAYYDGEYADHSVAKARLREFARACMAPLQKRADALQAEVAELTHDIGEALKSITIESDRADKAESALKEYFEAADVLLSDGPQNYAAIQERYNAAEATARSLINPTGGES